MSPHRNPRILQSALLSLGFAFLPACVLSTSIGDWEDFPLPDSGDSDGGVVSTTGVSSTGGVGTTGVSSTGGVGTTGVSSTGGVGTTGVSSTGGVGTTGLSSTGSIGSSTVMGDGSSSDGSSSGAETGGEGLVVALEEHFSDWDPVARGYTDAIPETSPFDDHATIATIAGQECLFIHTIPGDNSGFGVAVEFALDLDRRTDMSGEDFLISFDIFFPEEHEGRELALQFAFYETVNYTPIYSGSYTDVELGSWRSYAFAVDAYEIAYSGFYYPGGWIFDTVRLKVNLAEELPEDAAPLSFCVDNIVVTNDPNAI